MFASGLNAESSLAGWGAGLGVVAVLGAIVVFAGNNANKAAIGFGLLVLGLAPQYFWIARPMMVMGPYKEHLAEYMAIASLSQDPEDLAKNVQINGSMHVGKIVPIDMSKKSVDSLLMALPDDVRPGKPEEVGTIAALWWDEHLIGHYGTKGSAYQWRCTLVLWDKATKTPIAEEHFVGSEPPSEANGTRTGSKPYGELVEYLKKLHQ